MESSKEIKLGEDLRQSLLAGVNTLSNTVTLTLGPSGSTICIADERGDPYITKDGVSVANYIVLEDPVENIAIKLLKQVANKTVEEAGDGTTTSICLAQSFINIGADLLSKDIPYRKVRQLLEEIEEETIEYLFKKSKNLKKSNIVDVATISANNDRKIGKLIQKAYNHSSIVKVEEGNETEDKLITINGMELDTSYMSNAFVNVPSKEAVVYDDVLVILILGKLMKLEPIAKLLRKVGERPVMIIADHFSEEILSIFKDNYNRGALKIVPVKSPGFAGHRKNLMSDLSVYTGAVLLDPKLDFYNMDVIGSLSSINIGKHKSILTNTTIPEIAINRLKALETFLKESDEDDVLLQQRIENLTGKISVIKAGGNSEVEMKERKDRIEDATLAVQCALEEGIIEGAGVALAKAFAFGVSPKMSNEKVRLFDCIRSPYCIIADTTGEMYLERDLIKEGIIDPLKVTRSALQNAISVSKTILGMDAMVLNEMLWR